MTAPGDYEGEAGEAGVEPLPGAAGQEEEEPRFTREPAAPPRVRRR